MPLPRSLSALCLGLPLAACASLGGGATVAPGVSIQNGQTIVQDAAGPKLIIDENGCQTVVPASGPPELVRDANGAPVCVPVALGAL